MSRPFRYTLVFLALLAASFAAYRLWNERTNSPTNAPASSSAPVTTAQVPPISRVEPGDEIGVDGAEKFGPPLPSYPAREPGGDAYPAFMDRRDEKRFDLLLRILARKNDNDPRLDRDLKKLTPALKAAIAEEYFQRRPEERNAKGTLVLLVGREVETESDLAFIELVLREPPCLSLSDCAQLAKIPSSANAHASDGQELTLAYPQRVAVLWLERAWRKAPRGPLAPRIREILAEVARSSEVPLVRRAANEALARMK